MPKVTNEFQALIYRIESALHGTAASVEESAEVLNEKTGKTEEIDILVTFELGGRPYRTGIAVRRRSRDKGDKDWIRALSVQRTQLKLDRIVAVHSRGFTSTTIDEARDLNVELIEPKEVTDEQLKEALLPVDAVEVSRFRIRSLGYQSEAEISSSQSGENTILHVPGRVPLQRSGIEGLLCNSLRRVVTSLDLPDPQRDHLDAGNLIAVRFRIPLAPATKIIYPSGEELPVSHIVGEAEMQIVHAQFSETRVLEYSGRPVLIGTDPRFQDAAHLLIVPTTDNEFKVEAFVPFSPGASELNLQFPELRVEELSEPGGETDSL